MFRRADKAKKRTLILDIHTTSPRENADPRPATSTEAQVLERKVELYQKANQFYLRSKRRSLSRAAGIV
ncbi:MAG: hypothetical protein ACJ72Z_06720 [Pyrinomonadaceae bacterium]